MHWTHEPTPTCSTVRQLVVPGQHSRDGHSRDWIGTGPRAGGTSVTDGVVNVLHQAVASPWLYLVLFALAALDGFFPPVPGETALLTAAVFAGTDVPAALAVLGVGAAGAFAGDHIAYQIGCSAPGQWLRTRLCAHPRGHATFHRVESILEHRGGQVLLTSRYLPGIRTATTLTLGGVRYPRWKFALFDIAASSLWAGSWTLVGTLGGAAFGATGLGALALGIGLSVAVLLFSEAVRRVRRWSTRRAVTADERAE